MFPRKGSRGTGPPAAHMALWVFQTRRKKAHKMGRLGQGTAYAWLSPSTCSFRPTEDRGLPLGQQRTVQAHMKNILWVPQKGRLTKNFKGLCIQTPHSSSTTSPSYLYWPHPPPPPPGRLPSLPPASSRSQPSGGEYAWGRAQHFFLEHLLPLCQ